MRVTIEQVSVHRDGRGVVFEPLDPARIAVQRNVHVVLTQPGCVRGNHYHRRGAETLTVFGPALVRIRDRQTIKDTVVPEQQAVRFTIPPGVSHAILNTGSQPNLLIAFNTFDHDPADPDVVRDVLIDPSPSHALA
jgi:UDP-2-acetamido-2,6-beta-L-arabino-hexul-4-ose reductase